MLWKKIREYLNQLSKVLGMRIFSGPYSLSPDKWAIPRSLFMSLMVLLHRQNLVVMLMHGESLSSLAQTSIVARSLKIKYYKIH